MVLGVLVAAQTHPPPPPPPPAITASVTHSRLGAVAAMGGVGYTIALVFILFSAPDLGITQILVETLTVILLVLVLFRLPSFSNISTDPRTHPRCGGGADRWCTHDLLNYDYYRCATI